MRAQGSWLRVFSLFAGSWKRRAKDHRTKGELDFEFRLYFGLIYGESDSLQLCFMVKCIVKGLKIESGQYFLLIHGLS